MDLQTTPLSRGRERTIRRSQPYLALGHACKGGVRSGSEKCFMAQPLVSGISSIAELSA